ncbi:MAG: restriction endonuclease [Halalkalicoccus sp.]
MSDADLALQRALQSMDDYDFEHFVADLWERMGWSTEVSTQSADRGIDVVATRNSPYEEKALIQAKRYGPNTTVGSPAIQQYASLKHQRHGVDKVLVVTTNGFSGQAEELAHQLNVKLIDGEGLVGLVEDLEAADLVERYVPAIAKPEPEAPEPAGTEPSDASIGDAPAAGTGTTAEVKSGDVTGRSAGSWDEELAGRENRGRLTRHLPAERWKWVAGATGMWALGIALAGTDLGFVMFLAWVALPYAILKDGQWTRWRRWYAVAAVVLVTFAVFVGLWYLLMRWRAVGFESLDGETGSDEPTPEPHRARATPAADADSATRDYADRYDHYTEAVDDVEKLKREGRHDEAEALLWWCIEAAERQAHEQGYETVPPWYYEHLAIVYRKDGRYEDEVGVLERYVERGGKKERLLDRLDRARELAR